MTIDKLIACAIAAATIGCAEAKADYFEFSDSPSASNGGPILQGQFEANFVGSVTASFSEPGSKFGFVETTTDTYDITSISGLYDGLAIAGLSTYGSAANQIEITRQQIPFPIFPAQYIAPDFAFAVAGDAIAVTYGLSFCSIGTNGQYCGNFYTIADSASGSQTGVDMSITGPFTASAVPEPSTWAMLCVGFIGLGLFGAKRRDTVAA